MKQQPKNILKTPMARRARHVAELVAELSKVLKGGYRDLLTASGRQARVRKCATEIYVEVGPVLDYLERRFGQSKALLMAQRLDRLLVGYQECALLAIPEFEKQIPVDATQPGNGVIAITLYAKARRCTEYIQGWAIDIERDALNRSSPATERADAVSIGAPPGEQPKAVAGGDGGPTPADPVALDAGERPDDLMTLKVVRKGYRVSDSTLRRHMREGKLKSWRKPGNLKHEVSEAAVKTIYVTW